MKLNSYDYIKSLRNELELSQAQFGQLFDVHPMTVSKWERGVLEPSAYQQALMDKFQWTAANEENETGKQLAKLLIGAGAIAALIYLLRNSK